MSAWHRRNNPGEIRIRPDGFSVLRGGSLEFHIEWEAICGIAAFKRDLFTMDQICVAFRTERQLDYPFVTEEMTGYARLLAELDRRFRINQRDWRHSVALPFPTCWTVLWGDAPEPVACPDCGYDLRGTPDLRCPECGRQSSRDTCPDCGGRGYFRVPSFLRYGLAPALFGVALFIGLLYVPSLPRFLRQLAGTTAMMLVVFGVVSAASCLLRLKARCARCSGSGILTRRGQS